MEFHETLVVSELLPTSEATILNRGAVEGLHHGVTVGDSVPPATCYLTCDVLSDVEKETCQSPTGSQYGCFCICIVRTMYMYV